jgi:hypothetical protein
MVNLNQ